MSPTSSPRPAIRGPWAVAAAETLTGMEQLEMLAALPAEVAEQAVVAVSKNWHYDLLDHACAQLPAPWSPETTRALLHRYAALPDPRWRAGRPPAVLLARGDADLLGASWEALTASLAGELPGTGGSPPPHPTA